MKTREELQKKIYEIEDRIRTAPKTTSNKLVFDWYTEIDRLKAELTDLEKGISDPHRYGVTE